MRINPGNLCHLSIAIASPRMVTIDDIRRIALSLPGVVEGDGPQRAFGVPVRGRSKGICWEWMERVEPKSPKVPNPDIWAFLVPGITKKDALIATGPPELYVDDPHYNGYPAVVIRLAQLDEALLRELIEDAWISVGSASGRK